MRYSLIRPELFNYILLEMKAVLLYIEYIKGL